MPWPTYPVRETPLICIAPLKYIEDRLRTKPFSELLAGPVGNQAPLRAVQEPCKDVPSSLLLEIETAVSFIISYR